MIDGLKTIFSGYVMSNALEQFGSISIESFLLISALGFVVVLLITAIVWKKNKRIIISDVVSGIILVLYLSVIIQLTLLCRTKGSRIGIDLDLFHGLFGKEGLYHWVMWAYLILNCLMFLPYGFVISLFSFVNEKKAGIQFATVTLVSLITSLTIEMLQLVLQRGYFELQDLLTNIVGGVVGWVLFFGILNLGKALMHIKRR